MEWGVWLCAGTQRMRGGKEMETNEGKGWFEILQAVTVHVYLYAYDFEHSGFTVSRPNE